jgi:hypothetical protein
MIRDMCNHTKKQVGGGEGSWVRGFIPRTTQVKILIERNDYKKSEFWAPLAAICTSHHKIIALNPHSLWNTLAMGLRYMSMYSNILYNEPMELLSM